MPRNNPAFYLPCRFHLRHATLCFSVRFNYELPLFTPLAELPDSILFFQLTLSFYLSLCLFPFLSLFLSSSRPDPRNGGLRTDLPSSSVLQEFLSVSFFFREPDCNRSLSMVDAHLTSRRWNSESAIRKSDFYHSQSRFSPGRLVAASIREVGATNLPLCFFDFETAGQLSRTNALSLYG